MGVVTAPASASPPQPARVSPPYETPAETIAAGKLTAHEKQNLEWYEREIERGLRSFIEVGNALFAIRWDRLLPRDAFDL